MDEQVEKNESKRRRRKRKANPETDTGVEGGPVAHAELA
jgi:hypothetical protein